MGIDAYTAWAIDGSVVNVSNRALLLRLEFRVRDVASEHVIISDRFTSAGAAIGDVPLFETGHSIEEARYVDVALPLVACSLQVSAWEGTPEWAACLPGDSPCQIINPTLPFCSAGAGSGGWCGQAGPFDIVTVGSGGSSHNTLKSWWEVIICPPTGTTESTLFTFEATFAGSALYMYHGVCDASWEKRTTCAVGNPISFNAPSSRADAYFHERPFLLNHYFASFVKTDHAMDRTMRSLEERCGGPDYPCVQWTL